MAGDTGQKDPVALGRGDRRIAEQVRLVRWGPLTGSRQRAGGAASGDPRGGGRRTGVEVPSGAATRRPGGQVAEAGGQRCGRCVGSRGDRIGWRSPATTRTPREVHIGGRPRWRGAAGGRGPRGAYRRIAEQAWLARSRPSLGEAARGRGPRRSGGRGPLDTSSTRAPDPKGSGGPPSRLAGGTGQKDPVAPAMQDVAAPISRGEPQRRGPGGRLAGMGALEVERRDHAQSPRDL